jgi:hypothetical protein
MSIILGLALTGGVQMMVCRSLRSLPPVKCSWDWRSIGSSSCQQT